MADEPKTNVEDAVRFLEWKRPGGPWALITPTADWDRGTPLTLIREPDKLRAFIAAKSGRFGVFYPVAEVLDELEQQPEKSHLTQTQLLHVDLDPPPDVAPAEFDAWALGKVEEVRAQTHSPPPSCIVMSGNGLHLLWALDEPFPLGGSDVIVTDFEAYTNGLAIAFGAKDGTWNANRVLRLPGTVNLPNAKKRRDNRVARPSSIVELHPERRYGLADFRPVPIATNGKTLPAPGGGAAPAARDDVTRLDNPDALERWGVPPWARAVIVEGTDPTDPERWGGDRSRAVYAVTCELVRRGVPPGVIVGILTDKTWGISAHVLDQKRPLDYAWRQVEKAQAAATDSWPMRSVDAAVDWINQRYFALLEGKRVTFYREDGAELYPMEKEAFAFELAGRDVLLDGSSGDQKRVPAVQLWMRDARRRYYPDGFVLDPKLPGGGTGRAYNLWRGFGVEPRPGNWQRMRDHILHVLADGNADHANYITRYAAWCFQNPATPPRVALAFRGGEGVGKGMFAQALLRIFGHHGLHVRSMSQVTGRFNSHLRHCCLLFADEADAANTREEGALKGLITESKLACEAKHRDLIQVDNHISLVMASNLKWMVPAGKDSRRFAVFNVSSARQGDRLYFRALADEMRGGGLSAMLHDLLETDLTGFDPEHDRPDTTALTEQRTASLRGFQKVWFDALWTGELPSIEDVWALGEDRWFMPTARLAEHARRILRRDDISLNDVGELFNEHGFEKDRHGPRGYAIVPLRAARDTWDRLVFPMKWDDAAEWTYDPPPDRGASRLSAEGSPY